MLIKTDQLPVSQRQLNEDIDAVIDAFLSLKRSENTKRAYARDLGNFMEKLEVEKLQDLGLIPFPVMVNECFMYLQENTKKDADTGRVANAKTVNRKAYALSSFFKYLVEVYGYPKNPINQFQPHKIERRSTTESLTRAELVEILEKVKKGHKKSQTAFRNYLALCFLSVLALRRKELVGLKWSDIRHETRSINVHQKGGGYKLLPIPTALYNLLKKYRERYPSDCEYIFHPVRNNTTGTLDKPLNTNYIYQMIKKMVADIIPGRSITPHSMRKTFIELALNNQEDFISIINATGHSTVEMVKYYDTRDSLKNNAVHGLGNLV